LACDATRLRTARYGQVYRLVHPGLSRLHVRAASNPLPGYTRVLEDAMTNPRQLAERAEAKRGLPTGTDERFSGYGVMGLPFRSGHVLCLRRFPSSSIGPGYTSVWHRAPSGEWTFYQDVSPEQACSRYFGPSLRRALVRTVQVRWTESHAFSVEVDGGRAIQWDVRLAAPLAIRAMNVMASMMPEALWHNQTVLRAMGSMANRMLGAGRMVLAGRVPSGQHFIANPLVAWTIPSSRARIDGMDVGDPGPLPVQEHLGDFWIPQRGLFVIGRAFFEPFDPTRHRSDPHAEA
jgi:hypothetical protein